MTGGRWVFIGLTIAFALLFIFPVSAWPLQSWLRSGIVGSTGNEDVDALRAENLDLRTRLDVLSSVAENLPSAGSAYIPAFIYSRYPFNFRSELLINIGEEGGAVVGAAVAVPGPDGKAVFLGRVETVWPKTALVQTIFDPRFQLAVRVGPRGLDALLSGGAEPKLTLIAKSASVKAGDTAYVAAENLPYGLPIGTVNKENLSSEELFREATLNLSYDLNSLKIVWLNK